MFEGAATVTATAFFRVPVGLAGDDGSVGLMGKAGAKRLCEELAIGDLIAAVGDLENAVLAVEADPVADGPATIVWFATVGVAGGDAEVDRVGGAGRETSGGSTTIGSFTTVAVRVEVGPACGDASNISISVSTT